MNRLEGISAKTAIVLLGAFIVVGGFALGLSSGNLFSTGPALGTTHPGPQAETVAVNGSASSFIAFGADAYSTVPQDGTRIISAVTSVLSSTTAPGTTVVKLASPALGLAAGQPNSSLGGGAQIEFSSNVTIVAAVPQQTAAGVVALAYSVGGYVAYQSTYRNSAYVVIRVPVTSYQAVLGQVQAMGNVTSLFSNSNDVTAQYTDLNATLVSLRSEQAALLRLINESTTINSTLAIENQLQEVNQQINDVQSQILQTKTLIDFATVDVSISKTPQEVPLSMTLTATPLNGTAPLSVTFNAIIKGDAQPYFVNYNFGDGTADQGQILIHTYYASGDYKVTVSVTDQNGTVARASATIRVAAAPSHYGIVNFPTMVANLFVSVVEGIAEVAVVVLPLAAVGAVIVIPLRRRGRIQKNAKQGQ